MRHLHFGGARIAVAAAFVLSIALWSAPPVVAAQKISKEQAVQLQRKWLDFMVAADWKHAADMMAPELLWLHPTGRVDTKQSRLDALVKGPQPVWASIETRDIQADAYTDSAVVTSDTSWTSATLGAGETRPRVLHLRLTTVWVNQGGTWRVVRFQCTTIPPAST